MKKLFLGLFIAGTMMSFTSAETSAKNSEDLFDCYVEFVDQNGTVYASGHGATCQEARARALAGIQ